MFFSTKPHTARPKRDGGRWGVAQACNCRSILDAIASLLEAQRPDLALVLIEKELNAQTSTHDQSYDPRVALFLLLADDDDMGVYLP